MTGMFFYKLAMKPSRVLSVCFECELAYTRQNLASSCCQTPCCILIHFSASLPHMKCLMEVFSEPVVLEDTQTLAHTKTVFLHPSFLPSAPARSSYQHQKPVVHLGKQLCYLRKNWVMVKQVKLAMGSGGLLPFSLLSINHGAQRPWVDGTFADLEFFCPPPHNFSLCWLLLPWSLL